MTADAPKISVVIPTFNRRDTLLRTLDTLFAQDIRPTDYEIVVVIDGSSDHTEEALAQLHPSCTLRVLKQKNLGQAAARNAGWHAAAGEIILFLDDDMLCPPSLLHHHLAAHGESKTALVFGRTPVANESPSSVLTRPLYDDAHHILERLTRHPHAKFPDDIMVCSNTSLPRALLEIHGGFDERFFRWHEDMELGLRLYYAGVEFRYAPDICVPHLFYKRPETVVRNQYWNGRNSVLLCRLHPAMSQYTQLTPLDEGSLLMRVLRMAAIYAPFSPQFMLWPVFVLAEAMGAKRAAAKIHGLRCRINFFRGAIQEAGSVGAYENEFGTRRTRVS